MVNVLLMVIIIPVSRIYFFHLSHNPPSNKSYIKLIFYQIYAWFFVKY